MEFDAALSFEQNLALFRSEVERIDPACAKILFDNLAKLYPRRLRHPRRRALEEFHEAVKAAVTPARVCRVIEQYFLSTLTIRVRGVNNDVIR